MTPNRDIQTLEKDTIVRLTLPHAHMPEKSIRLLVRQAFLPAQSPRISSFFPRTIQPLERNKKKTMETPSAPPYNPHK